MLISRAQQFCRTGALELALRWSVIDLTDAGIDGGEMEVLKGAATWWASPGFNMSVNVQKVWNRTGGFDGEADGVFFRLMVQTQ